MKYLIAIFVLIMFCCNTSLIAQDNKEAKIDSLLDMVLFEDEEIISLIKGETNYQFFYARTNFENKTYFAGRDIGIEQQNYTAQLTYFNSVGISLGAGGIWFTEFDPKLYATTLSLGYSGQFSKKTNDYRYRASFDRYFFSKGDSAEHVFNSAFSLGLTLDKDFLGTRFDFSLLAGKEYAGNISWDIFGDITLLKLGTYDKIKFEPEVSLYFGTEETAYYEIGGFGRRQQYYLVEESQFGLLNTEIMLPISIDFKDFDLEIGYNFNFPNSLLTDEDLPVTSYFNISLGYIFSLN